MVDFTVITNTEDHKHMVLYLYDKCVNPKKPKEYYQNVHRAKIKWDNTEKEKLKIASLEKLPKDEILVEIKQKFAKIAMYFIKKVMSYILCGDYNGWSVMLESVEGRTLESVIETNYTETNLLHGKLMRFREVNTKSFPGTFQKLTQVLNLNLSRIADVSYVSTDYKYHDMLLALFNFLLDYEKVCKVTPSCSRETKLHRMLISKDKSEQRIAQELQAVEHILSSAKVDE
jgi:hypothetical protein